MYSRLSPSTIVGILIAVCIIAPLAWLLHEPGLFGKVWIVVKYNPAFWIVGLLAIGFGLYRKLTHPNEFAWIELAVQIPASLLAVLAAFSFFYYTTTNMSDSEIWNGKVTLAEYLEAWTQEVEHETCAAQDVNGNCTATQTVKQLIYHPPEWHIHTSNNEDVSTSKAVYRNYVGHFGGERKEILFHMGQVSVGDGNRFYVSYPGPEVKQIPSAQEHRFVNYLKASQSINLRRGSTNAYEKFLLPYPQIYEGTFGPIEVNRVLAAGVDVPVEWRAEVDRTLDNALTSLGKAKQVNLLVYVVGTSDRAFFHALEEHWIFGKKNDVIVVLGVKSFPKLDWVEVMAWTDVEEFKITLRNRITEQGDIANATALAATIVDQVSLAPQKGGYKRKPMAELEYLVADITLPWWASMLIVLLSGILSWGISWALINNEVTSE